VFGKNDGASQRRAGSNHSQGWSDDSSSYDAYGNPLPEVDKSNHNFVDEPHCAHHFMFYKNKIVFVEQNTGRNGKITLSCLGRSAGTVKEILSESPRLYTESRNLVTVVRRANGGSWPQSSSKAQRSVDSVSIDTLQKARLLADMNEYVAPKTAAWYGARGVPYRRGYLFYGPPGTGHSPLARAVAARFKRDIYAVSLLATYMSDSILLRLLNKVSNQSSYFEDVDSAGLAREIKDQIMAPSEKAINS
jgi:hypothetical protein